MKIFSWKGLCVRFLEAFLKRHDLTTTIYSFIDPLQNRKPVSFENAGNFFKKI